MATGGREKPRSGMTAKRGCTCKFLNHESFDLVMCIKILALSNGKGDSLA